jgi:hypothetical protein
MHTALINMHARRREPELAFSFALAIRDRLDSSCYAALLNACAKVVHMFFSLTRVALSYQMTDIRHICRPSTLLMIFQLSTLRKLSSFYMR